MRQIVVGPITTNQGIQTIQVWFRFPVPAARQAYYASFQGGYTPLAPGDYAVVDQAELNLFRTGQWVERAGFSDVIDPTSNIATIQARLVNLYTAAAAQQLANDNALLARWDSSYDGAAWTLKSS